MPFGHVTVRRVSGKIFIIIDPPEHGELSDSGRAENLVLLKSGIRFEDSEERLAIRLIVCRPLFPRSRSRW